MASNDNDQQEDIISHEVVETWSLDALKDYCRRRGYKVTGSKKELVSRVYFLYNNNVSEEPGAKQREASMKKDYKQLVNSGCPAPDPNSLKRWTDEKSGIKLWPPITYIDIHMFFKKNGGLGLSKEELTAYKTGKAYSYFSCDWLKEVFYAVISKNHKCCFLKADCVPSNRINDPPHSLWVKIFKDSGEVASAYCTCMAGLSQSCNHVAALLFKVNTAFKLDLSNPACTSVASVWKSPSTTKGPINMKLQEMNFVKATRSKEKGGKLLNRQTVSSKVREHLVSDDDVDSYKAFITDLREAMPDASVFLPGNEPPEDGLPVSNDADIICLSDSTNDQPNINLSVPAEMSALANNCLTTDDLIAKMTLTDEDMTKIEQLTAGQTASPLWFALRKGRITASNFYRVHTKMEKMKRDSTASCDSLINSLINPSQISHLEHIRRGSQLEGTALNKLSQTLVEQGHEDVQIKPCGLFIDKTHQYLGASPDGLVTCSCCQDRLVEIKCPTRALSCLPYLDGGKVLKTKTQYNGQVQGQLMITGLKESWFFIFYTDEDSSESSLQLVEYDENFCKELRANLQHFFQLHLAPKLIFGRKRKLQE